MSIRIRKRNGRYQKFRRSKIVQSLQKAGLETRMAKTISKMVKVENGMSAGELKYRVHNVLKKVESKVAEKYWSTRGFKVNDEVFEVDGSAIISEETMDDLDLHIGETIDIFNGEKYETVRAYEVSGHGINPGEIYLSHNDMFDIGVHAGSRIAIRKHVSAT